jgi:glycosyltransferase involved in cell wall biosynthesis
MKVSVVIPAFNAASFIRRTIDSALGQIGADLEVIVVDDGSTDGTADLVSAIGSGVRLACGPRRGVSAARNEGVRLARGRYIAFMDHDDLWEPGKVRRQADLLDADPRVTLVFTQARTEREGRVLETFPVLADPEAFLRKAYENLVHWNYIPMSSVMVRRDRLSDLDGSGPFDPRYRLSEDWDLWLRIVREAGPGGVAFIAEPLTRYMIVKGRSTERMADLRLEDIAIFKEQISARPDLASGDPRRCRATLYRLHLEAGYWLLKEGRRAESRKNLGAAWRLNRASLQPLKYLVASLLGVRPGAARIP